MSKSDRRLYLEDLSMRLSQDTSRRSLTVAHVNSYDVAINAFFVLGFSLLLCLCCLRVCLLSTIYDELHNNSPASCLGLHKAPIGAHKASFHCSDETESFMLLCFQKSDRWAAVFMRLWEDYY